MTAGKHEGGEVPDKTAKAPTVAELFDSGNESESPSSDDDDDDDGGLEDFIRGLVGLKLGSRGEDGQGEDDLVDTSQPLLSSFDLVGVAEYIRREKCENVIVLAGAGISVSAGIPDFRSPGSGLYSKLQRYGLPHPEAIFEMGFFRNNPEPFYTLAQELFPGDRYQPTTAHYFIKLLHEKGILLRCFTQNIDSLETQAGLPREKLVAAHGNFGKSKGFPSHPLLSLSVSLSISVSLFIGVRVRACVCVLLLLTPSPPFPQDSATCIDTGKKVPIDEVERAIFSDDFGWKQLKHKHGGLVKPDIVFFGEQLPHQFFKLAEEDFPKCDLLIVMGTSLVVQPFASLIGRVSQMTPRLLINREKVGTYSKRRGGYSSPGMAQYGFRFDKSNYRDALFLGDCDDGCVALSRSLGWEEDLNALAVAGRAR